MVGKYRKERKRLHWLVEAAHAAGLDPRSTRLTIVGTGHEAGGGVPRIQETAGRLGWSNSLTLCFNVPQREMTAIYQEHDVFVMTADREPFGAVVTEAMAHGLAVIAGDRVGASGCITHGKNGVLYASGDLYDLAAQLRHLAESPEMLERLGAEARKTIRTHCSPEAFAKLVEVLSS